MNKPELTQSEMTKFLVYINYVKSEIDQEGPLYDALRVLEINLKFEKNKLAQKEKKQC